MQLEQQLRNALQRDAAELVPVGPGPNDARRRAFRRKRRVQSGVVMLSAAALAGGTLAVVESRPAGPSSRVQSQPTAPAADLEWRTVDGTVAVGAQHFTTSSGVTYALSTAPGTVTPTDVQPQELYATHDGVAWTHTSLGATPWVADLAESKGVLYAVGTGPGSQAGTTDYKLATSSDGGAQWSDASVPVEFTSLPAGVKGEKSTRLLVARGANATVVIAKQSYYIDITSQSGDLAMYNQTPTGVQVLDASGCASRVNRDVKSAAKSAAKSGAKAVAPCAPKIVTTRPWSDFGVTDPSVLHQEEALVRTDGGAWQRVSIPADVDSTLLDVTATTNGFLMSEQGANSPSGMGNVELLSSVDGRSWSPLASSVPKFDQVAISGDRIIGTDSASNSVYVSDDAGATWISTQDVAGLLPSGSTIQSYGVSADAGPLGFAAIVRVDGPSKTVRSYLLHSSDGASWKLTDLNDVGLPASASGADVTVGADHIDVTFEVPNSAPADGGVESYKLVSLLATPKA